MKFSCCQEPSVIHGRFFFFFFFWGGGGGGGGVWLRNTSLVVFVLHLA